MDTNININVPALTKLVDYAASGIGSIAGPMLAPWRAGQELRAQLILARGDAEVQRILAAGQSDALQIVAEATADAREKLLSPYTSVQGQISVGKKVAQRIQFQEEKRQANILSVLDRTAEEVGEGTVPNQEPDHDWTARFFTDVQDVSSEEMQTLWAKVLAGEVQRPGGTSLRTLSILRNLDKATAALFQRFCSACVVLLPSENVFLDARVPSLGGRPGGNVLQKYGLSYGQLNVLNEHGLIIPDYDSWFDYGICIGKKLSESQIIRIPFGYQGRNWVLKSTDQHAADKEFKLSGVALTRSGQELSRVVGLHAMKEYSQDLEAFFESKSLRMTEVIGDQPTMTKKMQIQR